MAEFKKFKKPEDCGHWEGDAFVFTPPVELEGRTVRKIEFPPDAILEDGVTRDDVIHAILNPVGVKES